MLNCLLYLKILKGQLKFGILSNIMPVNVSKMSYYINVHIKVMSRDIIELSYPFCIEKPFVPCVQEKPWQNFGND